MSDRTSDGARQRLPAPVPIIPGPAGRPPRGEHDRRGTEAAYSVKARVRASVKDRRLGNRLENELAGVGYVLHHRVVDQLSAPVDHVVVCPTGVWSIRAVHVDGRISFDRGASSFTIGRTEGDFTMTVGAVDTPIATAIERRLAGIGYDWAPLKLAVCLTHASLHRDRDLGGVLVTSPRRLIPSLLGNGQLAPADVQTIAAVLDTRFPPAEHD